MTSGKLKPWQIGLFVLALVAVAFALVYSTRDPGPPLAKRVVLVDVTTGDLFELSTKSGVGAVIPELHPDTKKPVLFPVSKNGEKYSVERRYLDSLDKAIQATAIASDGSVTVSPKPIRTLERKRKS